MAVEKLAGGTAVFPGLPAIDGSVCRQGLDRIEKFLYSDSIVFKQVATGSNDSDDMEIAT